MPEHAYVPLISFMHGAFVALLGLTGCETFVAGVIRQDRLRIALGLLLAFVCLFLVLTTDATLRFLTS